MTTMTVSQFAKLKGVSRQVIHSKIQRGTLKAHRVGSFWLIDASEVRMVVKEKGRDGK